MIDSTTEEVIGRIPEGTPDDVDRAVEAARPGFEAWRQVPVETRVDACSAISAALAERGDEIAALIAAEVGMPLAMSRTIQAGLPAMDFGSMAQVASEVAWEEQIGNSLVVREPIGVVGCITPWNYPLHQICAKVAPALTAGCAVVVKPSEVTPLTSFILAEIIDSLDLPAGVFNLVSGYGPVVGEAIAATDGVDMVSFTGSTRAGKRVSEVAAGTVKRVALELGGKSANVILDDADLKAAVGYGVANVCLNSGQVCSAHTRMLVPRDKLAEATEIAAAAAERATPGDPFDEGSRLGPLVSETQQERVRGYIKKGEEEGAKLVAGGAEQPDGLETRLLRPAHGLLGSEAGHDDRPGGDLRAGALDHPLRLRGRGGRDRERHDLRAGWRRLVGRPRAREGVCAAHAHGPGADQRRPPSIRWRRSAATSSPGTAGSWAVTGSRSFSRSRASSSRDQALGGRVLSPNLSQTRKTVAPATEIRRHPPEERSGARLLFGYGHCRQDR